MINKIITVRKNHICDYCGKTICKGQKSDFYSGRKARYPKYDKDAEDSINDTQIGIEYWSSYNHDNDEKCLASNI